MNLPDNRVFDAFVRISDLPKEFWSERVEACSELTDSEKTHLKLLLEESDQTKNRIEEPVIDEVHGFAFFFEQDNSCSQVKANNNQHSIRHI